MYLLKSSLIVLLLSLIIPNFVYSQLIECEDYTRLPQLVSVSQKGGEDLGVYLIPVFKDDGYNNDAEPGPGELRNFYLCVDGVAGSCPSPSSEQLGEPDLPARPCDQREADTHDDIARVCEFSDITDGLKANVIVYFYDGTRHEKCEEREVIFGVNNDFEDVYVEKVVVEGTNPQGGHQQEVTIKAYSNSADEEFDVTDDLPKSVLPKFLDTASADDASCVVCNPKSALADARACDNDANDNVSVNWYNEEGEVEREATYFECLNALNPPANPNPNRVTKFKFGQGQETNQKYLNSFVLEDNDPVYSISFSVNAGEVETFDYFVDEADGKAANAPSVSLAGCDFTIDGVSVKSTTGPVTGSGTPGSPYSVPAEKINTSQALTVEFSVKLPSGDPVFSPRVTATLEGETLPMTLLYDAENQKYVGVTTAFACDTGGVNNKRVTIQMGRTLCPNISTQVNVSKPQCEGVQGGASVCSEFHFPRGAKCVDSTAQCLNETGWRVETPANAWCADNESKPVCCVKSAAVVTETPGLAGASL